MYQTNVEKRVNKVYNLVVQKTYCILVGSFSTLVFKFNEELHSKLKLEI